MKATTIYHPALGLFIVFIIIFCFVLPPRKVSAQAIDSTESSVNYDREELFQMLAPIALYPDVLLSQVLMASTYPIEVIEANRWIRRNPGLKGRSFDTALLAKDWSPSIKTICHFPSILALMSERITETTNLGNAFLSQEAEVMDIVQELRTRAYGISNLTTNAKQKIIVEDETILIMPADSRAIYVPYYDSFYIYGPWFYPAYPPHYWGPARVGIGISYWPRFYFGFPFGTWSYFDWNHRHIYINTHKRPRFVRDDRWKGKYGRWQHIPRHRRVAAYRDKSTKNRYAQHPVRSQNFKGDLRGFFEHSDKNRYQRSHDRTRIDRERQERVKIQRDGQKQQRGNRDRKVRQQTNQKRQKWEHVERQQQQRSRDNIFDRVRDGLGERRSIKRSKDSRQNLNHESSSKIRLRRHLRGKHLNRH